MLISLLVYILCWVIEIEGLVLHFNQTINVKGYFNIKIFKCFIYKGL